MEITKYNSDTGNRDLATEKIYPKNTPFITVLAKAVELKATTIVKSSYVSESRPGVWYIKGYAAHHNNYDEIKAKIEENLRIGKHSRRECYLIKYY